MFNLDGHGLPHSGVNVECADGSGIKLQAAFSIPLGDESARHSTRLCSGSGGAKRCLHCCNT
eukprot:368714-Pyramimonas_sp.AAC.1